MKLWQLDSILQGNRTLPASVAASNEEWQTLESLFNEMDELIEKGKRDILDAELPAEFAIAVLAKVGGIVSFQRMGGCGHGAWIRMTRNCLLSNASNYMVDAFSKRLGRKDRFR